MTLGKKLLVAAAVAGVWGWFTSLKEGDVLDFILRIAFVLGIVAGWHVIGTRRR